MNEGVNIAALCECGSSIALVEPRVSCVNCGSTKRVYNVAITENLRLLEGFSMKLKRPGIKKPLVTLQDIPDFNKDRQKLVHKQQTIDRTVTPPWYFKKVTDYETGEVIRYCSEPLGQHTGRGDARKVKKSSKSQLSLESPCAGTELDTV